MKQLYAYLSYIIICVLILSLAPAKLCAQKLKTSIGLEGLHSFHHPQSYWGTGLSAQVDYWVKSTLGLGVSTGLFHHQVYPPSSVFMHSALTPAHYKLLPLLGVIRYPIPIVNHLYGQDMFGYTLPLDRVNLSSGKELKGGFTYYFALGYVIKSHFDISVKVGRARLDKKNDPVNINEHNVGIKFAYIF